MLDGVALILALVVFGVLSGVLAGLLGVGGGIFMVPFLVLVAGFTQHEAQATSLVVILPTAMVATLALRQRGLVDVSTGLRIGAFGVAGSAAGAVLALAVSGQALRYAFAALLTIVGLRLLRDGIRLQANP